MEKPPGEDKKASGYELSESTGFKAGDTVRSKGNADEWTILGFSNNRGKVRLIKPGETMEMSAEKFKENFERVPEHALEHLVD